ncbi:TVP38/TMEM64 family protein [Robiginitomaculum antarcticum]|uniref:TVP38/TMEM64 family protein n=1 Tax=Robiginitomaculum antarcticum TaxID=437507 RepID=UPI00037AED1C|nr:TVP38/TMEM64 family protein [Robiginitomaculum antarcticum]
MTDTEADNGSEKNKKNPAFKYGPIAIIVIGFILFFALGGHKYVSLDTLKEQKVTFKAFVEGNYFIAALAFMSAYAALTAISFPGAWVLSLLGGFLFGTLIGGSFIVIGATVGAAVIFLAVRYAFRDWFKDKLGGKTLEKFEKGLQENELSYLFILRLVPAFPFFVVNIAPALFGVKFRNYLVTTFFGIMPGSFVYASVGAGIGAALDAGEDAGLSGIMTQPTVLLPIIGLIILALIPVIYKKIKGNPAES